MSMGSKFGAILAAAACAFGIAIGAAFAQEEDDDRLDEAWKDVFQAQEGVLTPKQSALLNNLAYQAAVSRVCDGFAIDQKKFMAGVGEAVEPPAGNLTDEQHVERGAAILVDLGMRVGVFIAEGNAGKDDFCKNAAEYKADAEVTHYWE